MKSYFIKSLFFTCMFLFLYYHPLYADITGYQFGGIKAQGDLSLSSRFGKNSTDTDHIINIADCKKYIGEKITISWSLNYTPAAETKYAVKMSLPGGSCGTSDLSTLGDQCHATFVVSETKLTNPSHNEFDVSLSELMNVLIENDCNRSDDKATNIYIVMNDGTNVNYQTIQFQIDLLTPYAPTLSTIEEGDSNLDVNFEDDKNTESDIKYKIYISTQKFDESTKSSANVTATFTAKSYQVTDLSNDVLYYVAVSAIDKNDNEGPISDVESAMPVTVVDFWEGYKSSGGKETGGFCSVSNINYTGPTEDRILLSLLMIMIVYFFIFYLQYRKGIYK